MLRQVRKVSVSASAITPDRPKFSIMAAKMTGESAEAMFCGSATLLDIVAKSSRVKKESGSSARATAATPDPAP